MITKLKSSIKNLSVLVIGDVGLDEFVYGCGDRVNPEQSVPISQVYRKEFKPGLAANVANNLSSLGVNTFLIGVTGTDSSSILLRGLLKSAHVHAHIIEDGTRPTTHKTRIIHKDEHVIRIDEESIVPIDDFVSVKVKLHAEHLLTQVDAVILQDYGKGVVTDSLRMTLDLFKQHKIPVYVDPSPKKLLSFYDFGPRLIKPNLSEAQTLTDTQNNTNTPDILRSLQAATHAETAIITLGSDGMIGVNQKGTIFHKLSTAKEVVDVCGAGDTVISVLTIFDLLGYPINYAMEMGNKAAEKSIGKPGTATVTLDELLFD